MSASSISSLQNAKGFAVYENERPSPPHNHRRPVDRVEDMQKPLCIDLYAGLGGWSDGFLAEGYDCVGFDIERHDYGTGGYPGQLVLQDVRTLCGSQFRDAAVIVASPPCQKYSYMAMPWTKAKTLAAEYRSGVRSIDELNELFKACFRIQREACEAAGRYIPLIVENVKGAQPWVGPAKWHSGPYFLWGDVPGLMPIVGNRLRKGAGSGADWFDNNLCVLSSKSDARRAASAQIAKIPFALSNHIAKCFKPESGAADSSKATCISDSGRLSADLSSAVSTPSRSEGTTEC